MAYATSVVLGNGQKMSKPKDVDDAQWTKLVDGYVKRFGDLKVGGTPTSSVVAPKTTPAKTNTVIAPKTTPAQPTSTNTGRRTNVDQSALRSQGYSSYEILRYMAGDALPAKNTPNPSTPTAPITPTAPTVTRTPTQAPVAAPSGSSSALAKQALLNNATTNLSNQTFWNSQDQATRTAAYAELQGITGSAEKLATFVKQNGITDLQKYSWWNNSPYKADAWALIQGSQPSNTPDWQTAESMDELNQFLNDAQSKLNKADSKSDEPPTKDLTKLMEPEKLKDNINYFSEALTPDAPAPEAKFEQKQADLMKEAGVEPLEAELSDLKAQATEIQDSLRAQRFDEEGKPVAMSVIAGRVSEEERQAQERLDSINRRQAVITDQLNTKYNTINMTMQAYGNDYTAANQAYEREFNTNLQAINLMRGIQQDAKTDQEAAIDNARANYTILANAVTSGTVDWSTATPEQKLQATKMELQAGLPAGLLEQLAVKSNGWEMKTVLPGTDESGNATATILQYNKQTGEYKTETLTTGYSSGTGSGTRSESNILNKSERTVGDTKYLDVVYKDGSTESIELGPVNGDTQKQVDTIKKSIVETIGKMTDGDMSFDDAWSLLKTAYPMLTDEQIDGALGGQIDWNNGGTRIGNAEKYKP